jgi:hypothetical protein
MLGYIKLSEVMLHWVADGHTSPSILLYSKLAIRKEEEMVNRVRRKRNFSTESVTFQLVHHSLMVE